MAYRYPSGGFKWKNGFLYAVDLTLVDGKPRGLVPILHWEREAREVKEAMEIIMELAKREMETDATRVLRNAQWKECKEDSQRVKVVQVGARTVLHLQPEGVPPEDFRFPRGEYSIVYDLKKEDLSSNRN